MTPDYLSNSSEHGTMRILRSLLLCMLLKQHCGIMAMVEPSGRRALLRDGALSIGSLAFSSSPALANIPDQNGAPIPGVSMGARLDPVYDGPAWSPSVESNLGKTRLQAQELSPTQQLPFSDQELYYAPFLFGSWKVKATLKRKTYPYGKYFVPSTSLLEGSPRNRLEQVGSTTTYEVHYFSTMANTMLGGPKSKVIADRGYNAISMSSAYQQLTPIQQVDWDPSKDPTRLSIGFGAQPVADDMRPLGPRRGEVYITAREAEFLSDSVYACSERSRSVTLATRNAIVSDTESITEFRKTSDNNNTVKAVSRIAVYLTPNPNSREGLLWQQVGGKAVAFFDYEMEMERITESTAVDGTNDVQRACVLTPKGVSQCE